MRKVQLDIKHAIQKAGLLAITVVFFAVQLLFNYEIANHASYAKLLSTNNDNTPKQFKEHKQLPKQSKHKGLRLNKRFFPESLPVIQAISVEAPETLFCNEFTVAECSTHIPVPLFLIQELRGPPVVA